MGTDRWCAVRARSGAAAMVFACAGAVATAHAADVSWIAPTGGLWRDAANWSPGLPGPSDDVFIDPSANGSEIELSGGDAVEVGSLGCNDGLIIRFGAYLGAARGGWTDRLNLGRGTLSIGEKFVVKSTFVMGSGSFDYDSRIIGPGQLITDSGSNATLNPNARIDRWGNHGTARVLGKLLTASIVNHPTGELRIERFADIYGISGASEAPIITNLGRMVVDSESNQWVLEGLRFVNRGTLTVQRGNVQLNIESSLGGHIEIAQGANLALTSWYYSPNITLEPGLKIEGKGNLSLTGTATIDRSVHINTGSTEFDGTLTFPDGFVLPPRLLVRGGTLQSPNGVLEFRDQTVWNNGALRPVSGIIRAGAVLAVEPSINSNASARLDLSGSLLNEGVVSLRRGILNVMEGTFENAPSGVIQISSVFPSQIEAVGAFINRGTIEIDAPNSGGTLLGNISNLGIIHVKQGALRASSLYSLGRVHVEPSGIVSISGSNVDAGAVIAGANFTGSGTLGIYGGAHTLGGTLPTSFSRIQMIAGTITIDKALRVEQTLNTTAYHPYIDVTRFNGNGRLDIAGRFEFDYGIIANTGGVSVLPGATLRWHQGRVDSRLDNWGTIELGLPISTGVAASADAGAVTSSSAQTINHPTGLIDVVANANGSGMGMVLNKGRIEVREASQIESAGIINEGVITIAPMGRLTFRAGGLHFAAGGSIKGPGLIEAMGGDIVLDADATLGGAEGGSFLWIRGNIIGPGSLTLAPQYSFQLDVTSQPPSTIPVVIGTNIRNQGFLGLKLRPVNIDQATLTNEAGATLEIRRSTISGTGTLRNAGTLRVPAAEGGFVNVSWENTGTFALDSGLVILSSGVNRGTIAGPTALSVSAGVTELASGSSTSAPVVIGGSGALRVMPGADLTGPITVIGGTLDLRRTVESTAVRPVRFAGSGVLEGPGDMVVRNQDTWTATRLGGSGKLLVEPGAELVLRPISSDPAARIEIARAVENRGTLGFDRFGHYTLSNTKITNHVGGLVRVTQSIDLASVASSFHNEGRVEVNHEGLSYFRTDVVNRGTIAILRGTWGGLSSLTLEISSTTDLLLGVVPPETAAAPLSITGPAALGGLLSLRISPGHTPTIGAQYPLVFASQFLGDFSSLSLPELAIGQGWWLDRRSTAEGVLYSAGVRRAGDTNLDGRVDQVDLTNILFFWGRTGFASLIDVNNSALVDFGDVNSVLANWTSSAAPMLDEFERLSVPTPGTAAVAGLVAMAMLRRRRGR